DGAVKDRREAYQQAIAEVRELVDSAAEKYRTLAKDEDVKKALGAVSKSMGTRIKLGPSHDFSNNIKLFEKYEKAASNPDPEASTAKPARRSRSETKGKHSPGTGAAAALH